MNPLLPSHLHTPDVEARVFGDRLYMYGSHDHGGDDFYCSREYRVYSTADLVHWAEHGRSFPPADLEKDFASRHIRLYAPDVVYAAGAWRLFYCTSDNGEAVAQADDPRGPFVNPRPIAGADGDAIDPAALVEKDGSVYLFWGQHRMRGAKLKGDFSGIEPSTLVPAVLNEKDHGFHEGSSIRKIDGRYHMIYCDTSRGKATCLAHATADKPLGPYTKRGILIDNDGCDPETWNNHGSLCEFGGRLLLFYHRSSRGSKYSRRVCAEVLDLKADGSIAEVKMTTQGLGGPLDPYAALEAWRACGLKGKVQVDEVAGGAEAFPVLSRAQAGDTATFRYLAFGGAERTVVVESTSATEGGTLEILTGEDGDRVLARVAMPATGSWGRFVETEAPFPKTMGIQTLRVRWTGDRHGRISDLKRLWFR